MSPRGTRHGLGGLLPIWRHQLPLHTDAPAEARRLVRELVGEQIPHEPVTNAALLTSELVSNALMHSKVASGTPIELTVRLDGESLHVSVRDQGEGFDPDALESKPEGGLGLVLVEKMASEWGVTRGPAGNDVWFRIRSPD
jgi:anti-sigma regulatory factor (Ser/Thr protein kinase)